MPARAKKPAAHDRPHVHHNNSNSLGLAAPGKRIPKQKPSNPNLNGSANGHPHAPSPVQQSDSPLQSVVDQQHNSLGASVNGTSADAATMGAAHSHQSGRGRTPSGASEDDLEAHGVCVADAYGSGSPLRIDVNAAGNKSGRQQKSKLAVAATILTACPLWDVIAILIILLQLPPTIISLVHLLFAAMTFVPPSVGTSLNNLPNVQEMFMGTGGAPSIQTIIIVDLLMLIVFLPLWTPAQNIALDLAQAVIAISLGGAAASQGGISNSVLCCLTIIGLSHMLRWKVARQLGFNLFWTGMIRSGFQAESAPPPLSDYSSQLNTPHSWSRSLLGVHILAQGILRMVRRYLLWRAANTETPSNSKKVDTETGSTSVVNTPRTASHSDFDFDPLSSISTDGRPPGPSPASSSTKDRSTSSKKKKKLGTHVRMQQPFWAAIASTKVTVFKEYEHTQASLDAEEADAADLSNMGNVKFKHLRDQVWITEIGASNISFGLCLPSLSRTEENDEEENEGWFVRVNGALWHSTKKMLIEKTMTGNGLLEVWEGRIYGLTAISSYHCEFVRERDQAVIFETTLVTQPAPSTEAAAVIPPPTPAVLTPSSPTTTLRNSLKAAENDADSIRSNLKAARKQHKSTLERLQSQIDREKSKLSNNGGTDERQRQRAKQLENSIAKLKADQEDAERLLVDLGGIPPEDKAQYEKAKKEAREKRKMMEGRRSTYEKSKQESDKGVAAVKAEIDALLHKRTRFESRQKEYANRLAEAEKAKERAANAKSHREQQRQEFAERRRQQQAYLEHVITDLERQIQDESTKATTATQMLQQFENWPHRVPSGVSAPGTPEGHAVLPVLSSAPLNSAGLPGGLGSSSLPGSRPSSLHGAAPGFTPGFQFPAPIGPPPGIASRRRASSLEAEESPYRGFPSAGIVAPPGFSSFTPTSSSALLPNSTAFSSSINTLSNGYYGPVPAPVGAEKEGRRKGSGGSHGSNGGGHNNGSGNGSPRFAKPATSVAIGGLVSPPGSAVWERKD